MKQIIDVQTWENTPRNVQLFVIEWKYRKYPQESPFLTLGQCIELLRYISHNFRKEDSDGRFFNNILVNDESVVGWEGEELIDILYYECVKLVKMKIRQKLIKKQLQDSS